MARAKRGSAAAFTLFEVAVSLLLLASAIAGVLLAFPVGIRTQQLARYRLYAAARAEELVELFATAYNANPGSDYEGLHAWDVPMGYRNLAHDLESRVANPYFGAVPLPVTIARRLDSEGDAIQRVLDDGGYLYYSLPMASMDLGETALAAAPSNETQKLVFAVVGAAQANALYSFPWKAWPYHYPCPSPPLHGINWNDGFQPPEARFFPYNVRQYWRPPVEASGNFEFTCWEEIADPEEGALGWPMKKVFEWRDEGDPADSADDGPWYGFRPYAYNPIQPNSTEANGYAWQRMDPPGFSAEGAIRYLQAALWYAQRVGLPEAFWNPPAVIREPPQPWPSADPTAPGRIFAVGAPVPPHRQVRAMRFLAHAAMCSTRWRTKAELDAGLQVPAATIDGFTARGLRLDHELIVRLHESCLGLAMSYAAHYPYDWGAPRPIERAIMMDHPLIEWDVGGAPVAGEPHGGSGYACRQWKPVAGSPVRRAGRSYTYPSATIPDGGDAAFWGEAERFTLARAFAPSERCRQLVFWVVDWKAYEDCETAPSAPLDSSKWLLAGPVDGRSYLGRMYSIVPRYTHQQIFNFRNPEYVLSFGRDLRDEPTGLDVSDMQTFGGLDWKDWEKPDVFSGVYGADRDFDQRLDRGPVPPTTRMRAHEVARYVFYDPRVPGVLR